MSSSSCVHKQKVHPLKQCRNLKGTDVYLNEHLIKRNADIAKKSKIRGETGKVAVYGHGQSWTHNCKAIVKLNSNPEQAKVLCIRSLWQLDRGYGYV